MFSILGPERAKKLSIGVHALRKTEKIRQPLDRERDLEMDTETESKNSQTRRIRA